MKQNYFTTPGKLLFPRLIKMLMTTNIFYMVVEHLFAFHIEKKIENKISLIHHQYKPVNTDSGINKFTSFSY